ncbi:gliding motility protein GldL [Bacteroidales bacterium OttesenSCG-928-K03]|nr:gliding motility protein GldL [Odoribacter sp. OttesenSCG-928-L07]MDL2238928.1 gliding motility protein GldL [Bacteroidales bacterium OttesenSCG-928-L14]MDL2240966.1 gliding motility protein GldL [Bacteroidales bacterium OttesenSCG-928-K22]MDL2242904.1 gliding motility protein GldL [Bacteroidales bacterium OttesenSCG-928-K03]
MGLAKLTSSKGWKNFMAKLYGWGAALVILGALFKLVHWNGANIMLSVGMITEAVIFFFSAFEPPHTEPNWSLVYPELAEDNQDTASRKDRKTVKHTPAASNELDNLLQNANIDPALLKNLGDGFNKLNNTVTALNDITSIGSAGKDLTQSLKVAGEKTDSFSENLSSLNTAYESQVRRTNEQFEALADRMTKVFEMQLQKTNEQNSANEAIQNSMNKFIESMKAAVDYNEKYQKESAKLAENLAELNKVYSNMLTALNYNKK